MISREDSKSLEDEDLDGSFVYILSVTPRLPVDRFSSQLHEISETILQMSKQSLGKAKWLNQVIKMVSGRTVIWLQPPVSLPTL